MSHVNQYSFPHATRAAHGASLPWLDAFWPVTNARADAHRIPRQRRRCELTERTLEVLVPYREPRCTADEPELTETRTDGGESHLVACHLQQQLSLRTVAD